MWRRYRCLTSFLPNVDTYLSCEDTARQICAMVRKWRFLRPVFSTGRVQHISYMHSKCALRPHHVWKYGIDIQSPTAEIRRGKKKKIETTGQKYNGLSYYRATITRTWANAQRDGCPAEYSRRPVLNAAKFGSRPLLDCRAVTLPIMESAGRDVAPGQP